jgi:hypothetical protein
MSATLFKLPVLTLFIAISIHGHGQDAKKVQLKEMVDSKNYHFDAQSARTAKGKTIHLSAGYFLDVKGDSLNVDLPYYGQAYSASYSSTDQGIQFKSTNFTYTADTTKKGGWEITIIPKNEPKANKILLSVSSSGYCNINVMSNTRQQISFYGLIETGKK